MASHPDSLDIDIPGLASQFIGGKWLERNPTFVDVISPTTEGSLVQVADPTPADADAAVVAARKAFDNGPWPDMPVIDRVTICRRLWRKGSMENGQEASSSAKLQVVPAAPGAIQRSAAGVCHPCSCNVAMRL